MFINYIYLLRIKHWIKNLVLFTPFIFARKFDDIVSFELLFQAFFVFCILSSTIYIFNDICDVKEDSQSEIKKKEKPIANKSISLNSAIIFLIFLILLDIFLLYYYSSISYLGIFFLLLNFLYSIILKKIIILDAISIGFSYLIRVFAGASVISVPVSFWLVSLIFSVSLFVVFSKRYSESLILKEYSRVTVNKKNENIYKYLALTSCFISCLLYSSYVVIVNVNLILSIPLTFFIFYRIIYNLFKNKMRVLSPVNTIFNDKWLIISLLSWICIIIFN
tara:strand:- start:269 stop:1102 length:834 start_codon:yes stop_codon:yes gene_type:complete